MAIPIVLSRKLKRNPKNSLFWYFFFNDPATTEIYTLSLHDALPIYIDGRGQAEVQYLTHDIGRLKEEGEGGKLGVQGVPELANVFPGGTVLARAQRNQNLAIELSDGGAVAHGDIEAGVGQPDIVQHVGQLGLRNQGADARLHFREVVLGFLDAGAGRGAHVQPDLAGIHLREKVLAQERSQSQTDDANQQEAHGHQFAVRQRRCQQAAISAPHVLKLFLEAVVDHAEEAVHRLVDGAL